MPGGPRPYTWRRSVLTSTVLGITLVTEFTDGAYIVLIAIPALFLLMRGIARHYDRVCGKSSPRSRAASRCRAGSTASCWSPSCTPATLRALAFARATRPDTLVALTVQTSPSGTAELLRDWNEHDIEVPLTDPGLALPRGDQAGRWSTCATCGPRSPRDVVCVFLPEYVVGHWWEQLLHNQSAAAAEGTAAFPARSHGHQRALAARLRGRT